MNTVLWVMQTMLAAFFIMPGIGKIRHSKDEHVSDGHLKATSSILPIRVLGILELLGCIGIIVPWLTGVLPVLTPIAAACFALEMAAAHVIQTKKKEYKMLPFLLVVFAVAVFVAYFRFTEL